MKTNSSCLVGLGGLVLLIILGMAVTSIFGGPNIATDGGSLTIYDPARNAQATAIAQRAADEAALRAIQREREQAATDTEKAAQPSALAGKLIGYFVSWAGLGVAILVLCVGTAFAVVAWLNKHATTIYPDARGQFPIIIRRGIGWLAYHDPNRGLGPATVIRTPTLLDALTGVLLTVIKAARTGETPGLAVAEPQAAFPAPASEDTLRQIASQAQASQLMAAAVSGKVSALEDKRCDFARQVLTSVAGPTVQNRMPRIEVISDPQQITAFEQRMLVNGER